MKTEKTQFKNTIKIIEDENNKYIEKKTKQNIKELFEYLDSRDFHNHPEIIEESNNDIRYKYIEESFYPKEEKQKEFLKTVSLLHYKTTSRKQVSKKKYKDIYTKLINNIDYLKEKYTNMINKIEEETYMSPSNYLFARNYSLINSSLIYAEKELNSWYRIVENKQNQRVSIIHNNLSESHFIRSNSNENNYLISWDKYLVDTPILDLYKLYDKELFNIDFIIEFKTYSEIMQLSEEEIKLFNILISIPQDIDLTKDEYKNVIIVKNMIKRIKKSNELIIANVFKVKDN